MVRSTPCLLTNYRENRSGEAYTLPSLKSCKKKEAVLSVPCPTNKYREIGMIRNTPLPPYNVQREWKQWGSLCMNIR